VGYPPFIPERPDLGGVGPAQWPLADWTLAEVIPVFLMSFGLVFLVDVLLGSVLGLRGEPAVALASILGELAFLGPLVWARWAGRGTPATFGLVRPEAGVVFSGIGVGFLMLFASGAATVAALAIARALVGYTPHVPNTLDDFSGTWELVGAVLALVAAPLCEEVLFRGFLFQGLRVRWRFWPAAVISAGLFALVHGSVLRLPAVFVVGLLLAWLFERKKTLAAPIAAHMTLNLIAVVFAYAR
jgi:membrane protease YdiL (CAAX protease family)